MAYKPLTDEVILQKSNGNKILTYKDFNLKLGSNSTVFDKDARIAPIKGSIYDPEYFGSVFRDRCNCGLIKNKINVLCVVCHSRILPADEELFRFAYIDTTVYTLNRYKINKFLSYIPDTLFKFPKLRELGIKTKIDYLYLANFRYNKETNMIDSSLNYDETVKEKYCSIEGFMEVLKEKFPEIHTKTLPFLNRLMLVSPISHRPVAIRMQNGKKELSTSPESISYMSIVFLVEEINKKLNDRGLSVMDRVMYKNLLRKYIMQQVLTVSSLNNSSKQNIARNLVKKRVPNSARAYIVPDIDLPPDAVSVPIKLAYEMYKSEFLKHLREKYQIPFQEAEVRYIDYKTYNTLADFRSWISDRRVIINRAPTLHKGSIGCYKIQLTNNYTMGMNPLVISEFGADFDGDSLSIMAVPENYVDYVDERIGVGSVYYKESNLQPLLTPSHEYLLGLNLGTRVIMKPNQKPIPINNSDQITDLLNKNKIDYNTPLKYKGKVTSYGRLLVSTYIKDNLDDLIGEGVPINSKNIFTIMEVINRRDDRINILHKVSKFGSEMVRYKGVTSLTLNDLYLDLDTSLHKKMLEIKNDDNLSEEVKLIRINDTYAKYVKQAENSLTENVKERLASSNRIKMKQVLDLSIPKISIDSNGVADVMSTNILNGLSPDDYYTDAITNRKTVGIKQSGVGGSGYVTRMLVTVGKPFKYEDSNLKTDSYIEIEATDKLLGRVKTDGKEVTKADFGKMVKVPSCIFNKDHKLYKNQVTSLLDYYQDSNIGYSYSTTLTEAITQSVLSIKHNATYKMILPQYIFKAKQDGRVDEIGESSFTLVYKDGTRESYPKSSELIFNLTDFKKDDIICYIHKLTSPTYRFDALAKLISSFPIVVGSAGDRNSVQLSTSYSPYSGNIKYEYVKIRGKNKVNITVGGQLVDSLFIDSPTLFNFPDGAYVNKHDKITSDILSMNKYLNHNLSGEEKLKDRYEVFRKQFIEINGPVTEDLIEFLYRICSVKLRGELTYSGITEAFKELPALSRIAFGYANKTLDNLLEVGDLGEREDPLDILFRSYLQYNNNI